MPRVGSCVLLAIVAIAGCSDTEGIVCPEDQRLNDEGTQCVSIPCEGGNVENRQCVCGEGQILEEGRCLDASDPCIGFACNDGSPCTDDACVSTSGAATCEFSPANDGATCMSDGVSGTCDSGSCMTANTVSCDSVDCDDGNPCTIDGVCDETTGECPEKTFVPVDQSCGGDDVCDGAGACVECNRAAQCSDGNGCTEDTCGSDGMCSNVTLGDGTTCDRSGEDGVCETGTCVEPPAPCVGNPCDDDNECTNDTCTADGASPVCSSVDKPDDTACTAAGDVPGACSAGTCVGLCVGKDCTSGSQCIEDGECNPDTGLCVAGANEVSGTPCTESGGSVCDGAGTCVECTEAGQCTEGDACNEGVCGADNRCEYVPLTELAECSPNPDQEACYEGFCRPVFPNESANASVAISRDLGSSGEIEGTLSSPFGDSADVGGVSVAFSSFTNFDREVTLEIRCESDAVGLDDLEIRVAVPGQTPALVECGDEVTQVVSPPIPVVQIQLEFVGDAPGFLRWSVLARVTDIFD